MHPHVALLWFCAVTLAPGSTALPPDGEAIRNARNKIVNMAETTLVHINNVKTKLLVSPEIDSSYSIEGLASIFRDLALLKHKLEIPFVELLSQIHTDVSSTWGHVKYLAKTMDCAVHTPQSPEGTHDVFPDTRLYQTLVNVQHYMDLLRRNKDKLKIC